MNAVFADTSFFVAGINRRDCHHATARKFSYEYKGQIVTSQWVLLEVANFFAASRRRLTAFMFVEAFIADPKVECIAATSEDFANGWLLYSSRPDKEWSLTDCISMSVMRERGIIDVLSSDHHFDQAGFRILLK